MPMALGGARAYLNRRLSETMLLVDPCQRLQEFLANFFALSRAFDSAARHSSVCAIPQFAQDAVMAVPRIRNFTKRNSNGLRQYGQQSAWSSLMGS
jgi:hypothetical protein